MPQCPEQTQHYSCLNPQTAGHQCCKQQDVCCCDPHLNPARQARHPQLRLPHECDTNLSQIKFQSWCTSSRSIIGIFEWISPRFERGWIFRLLDIRYSQPRVKCTMLFLPFPIPRLDCSLRNIKNGQIKLLICWKSLVCSPCCCLSLASSDLKSWMTCSRIRSTRLGNRRRNWQSWGMKRLTKGMHGL